MSHLCFVGMMGSGKTTVAQLVSQKAGMEYADTDMLIEEKAGMDINEIFKTHGEDFFRELESQAIEEIMKNPESHSISTGGGVVMSPTNRELMQEGSTVVWLKVSPEELERRIIKIEGDDIQILKSRPLLGKAGEGEPTLEILRRLSKEREKLYVEVSNLILDGDSLGAGKLADMAVRYHTERSL